MDGYPYPIRHILNAMNIVFQFNYPEAEDLMPQQSNYIRNYVTDAENALTSSIFTNPDWVITNTLTPLHLLIR